MSLNAGMMTSLSEEWPTPQRVFDALNAEYGPFTLDPCANDANHKTETYYTAADDGLMQPWSGRVFMNPPYGKQIGQWVEKAFNESQRGALVVCLLPARTDTAWWHSFCERGERRFLRGRLKFGDGRGSAPFPSAVVIFKPTAGAPSPAHQEILPGLTLETT